MGTLTGNQTHLPGQCEHKLPTSCRLTSIPQCCACADERAHAAAYSTYVDGVGFVPWGTRWQRYCWYCREFWEKRVSVSGMRPAQTRLPELPDQTEFLGRWYDLHRGFRIVSRADGSEERIAVLGEGWRDVDPGCLPRTLEEMRAGRAASDAVTQRPQVEEPESEGNGQTLEDTLDQMFQEAEAEDTPSRSPAQPRQETARSHPHHDLHSTHDVLQTTGNGEPQREDQRRPSNIHAQAMAPAGSHSREYQARRIAALRRELHRMRNGIERVNTGLRDLGEHVPEHAEATSRLTALGSRLDAIDGRPSREDADLTIRSVNALANNTPTSQTERTMAGIQARVDEARQHFDEARRNRDQAASELDVAEQEFGTSQQRVQQLQREQRTTENYLLLFGTREEMLAQGDQYESPIGGMFSRAYQRFHAAEEVRQEERTLRRVLEDEARAGGEAEARGLAELEARERDMWSVPRSRQRAEPAETEQIDVDQQPMGELEEYYALLRRQNWSQRPPGQAAQDDPNSAIAGVRRVDREPHATEMAQRVPRTGVREQSRRNESNEGEDMPGDEMEVSDNTANNMLNRDLRARPASQPSLEDVRSEWGLDAVHLLNGMQYNPVLMTEMLCSPAEVSDITSRIENCTETRDDQLLVNRLFSEPRCVWPSRAVAASLSRRREHGGYIGLTADLQPDDGRYWQDNVEIMAEALQMSAELRRRVPGLTGPQQLRMLYRLQAGERCLEDVESLEHMLQDDETFELASRVHSSSIDASRSHDTDERHRNLEQQRREAARAGDHSRQELDAQRRATRAFAVAAGRTAMRTGPSALLEQMASRNDETQATYERLRGDGWAPDGDTNDERLLRRTMYGPFGAQAYTFADSDSTGFASESEAEDDEPQGLDAKDTGRPEPKGEEEMRFSMDCRICFTQVAEIACLPCGHLVMCKWCSEQHSPVMAHDHTRPKRAAGCPVCRKGIRQKVRVFRA